MGNIRERQSDMQIYEGRKRGKLREVGPGRRTVEKIIRWLVLTWAVVVTNIILLMQLRHQVNDLDDAFVRLQGRLAVIVGDQALTDKSLDVFPENAFGSQNTVITDYADLWGLDQVDKPKERTPYEILRRLEELGKDSGLIAQIAGGTRIIRNSFWRHWQTIRKWLTLQHIIWRTKGLLQEKGLQRVKSHRNIRFFFSGIPGGDMLPMEMTAW